MNKLLLGRYIPGNSFIHKMDPRAKLLISFYFIFVVFFANSWQTVLLLLALVGVAIILSKVKIGFFLKGVRPMVVLIMFTVALQVLFITGGEVYFHWGIITISHDGLVNGVYIFFRFVMIILMSTLLTLTTAPLEFSDALEYLLRPLKVVRFPAHEASFMLSIALRFVPTLMDETEKIMNAQRARGVDFGEGNLIQKIKAVIPLLIPLFVSSFNRAEELANAMEARGYQGGEGRTKYRILKWQLRDTIAVLFLILYTGIFIYFRK